MNFEAGFPLYDAKGLLALTGDVSGHAFADAAEEFKVLVRLSLGLQLDAAVVKVADPADDR